MKEEFILDCYLGLWYQAYSTPLIQQLYEQGGTSRCVRAYYSKGERANTVTVRNEQILSDQTIQYVQGVAVQEPIQTHFKIFFGNIPIGQDYWIMNWGPIVNGLYQWSIVSNANRTYLYILCRNIEQFHQLYENEVLQWVKDQGYDNHPWTTPVATNQHQCEDYDTKNLSKRSYYE